MKKERGTLNTSSHWKKAKYNAKTCYKLIDEDGTETSIPEQILEKQKEFYANLYSLDEDVSFNLTNTTSILVPEDIRNNQETQISSQDLEQAIKKLNNNKTPGEDGIPVDFYKVFWKQLKEPFTAMVDYTYHHGALHASARRGILNLIPKSNKDTRYVKNLRPITLLNTDYKIIEKAIANKMIPALEHIIH